MTEEEAFELAMIENTQDWPVPPNVRKHPETVWAVLGRALFQAGISYERERCERDHIGPRLSEVAAVQFDAGVEYERKRAKEASDA